MKEKKDALINYWKDENVIKDEKIIKAFREIPRENFILKEDLHRTYGDYPLDIGFGATISQPTTVVIMLESLDIKEGNKILEIGTGSGWSTALLSVLAGNKGHVYSVEVVKELVDFARDNLKKLKIRNAEIFHADGSKGFKKYAPYDRIILHAASDDIPEEMIKQLKNKGIFLGPVGNQYNQTMVKVVKEGKNINKENLGDFIFIPLKKK